MQCSFRRKPPFAVELHRYTEKPANSDTETGAASPEQEEILAKMMFFLLPVLGPEYLEIGVFAI